MPDEYNVSVAVEYERGGGPTDEPKDPKPAFLIVVTTGVAVTAVVGSVFLATSAGSIPDNAFGPLVALNAAMYFLVAFLAAMFAVLGIARGGDRPIKLTGRITEVGHPE